MWRILGVVCVLWSAACATLPSTTPPLAGTSWLVEDLEGRGVIDRAQTTLVFDADGGVVGSTACNRYRGPAEVTEPDGTLTFGPLATTRRACPAAVMDQEQRFLDALGRTVRYAIDDRGFLLLYDAAGTLVVTASPFTEPDSETP